MDTRPREERELAEFYSNLDETKPLPVFLCKDAPPAPEAPKPLSSAAPPTFTRSERKLANARIAKQYVAYGYRAEASRQTLPDSYTRTIQDDEPRLVLYDMDEQDELYLEWLNLTIPGLHATPELLEVALSLLEAEWHKLEVKMRAVLGPGYDKTDDLKLDNNYDMYGCDDGTGGVYSLSEQRCAVCNDLEGDHNNAIVFCDGCNIAVHQECYGIAFIPEGQWFCRRCMVSRGTSVECVLCPSKTGAFKQLDNGLWSHVVCAIWISEVYFANPVYLEPIEGVDSIPRNRWRLVCYICKQKSGACIQCSNRNCFLAYHVTCAKRAGLYMAMDKGVQAALTLKTTLRSYCDKHSPHDWDRMLVVHGIARTRLFYRDLYLLGQKNDRLASRRRQENRVNSFKWRTEHHTPIAPQLFADMVLALMKAVHGGNRRALRGLDTSDLAHQESLQQASKALCRYWCLKREAKKGAPLVRQHTQHAIGEQPPIHGANEAEVKASEEYLALIAKIKFGQELEADLDRLIDATKLTVERQRLLSTEASDLFDMSDVAYFALETTARKTLAKITDHTCVLHTLCKRRGPLAELAHDVMPKLKRHCYTNAEEISQNVRGVFERGDYDPADAKVADKALRLWTEKISDDIKLVETAKSRQIPFADINGLEFAVKPRRPRVLQDEGLSDDETLAAAALESGIRTFLRLRN